MSSYVYQEKINQKINTRHIRKTAAREHQQAICVREILAFQFTNKLGIYV